MGGGPLPHPASSNTVTRTAGSGACLIAASYQAPSALAPTDTVPIPYRLLWRTPSRLVRRLRSGSASPRSRGDAQGSSACAVGGARAGRRRRPWVTPIPRAPPRESPAGPFAYGSDRVDPRVGDAGITNVRGRPCDRLPRRRTGARRLAGDP